MPALKNNLLIVEDDAQVRTLLAAILSNSGYRVRAAEDGFTALAEMRISMPDLILSDLYMLGMSGFELLSVIRRRFPEVTVVAMSSAFSGGEIPHGVAADAFYQKATSISDLLRIVAESAAVVHSQRLAGARDPSPIWIAAHSAKNPAGPVTIACPECLRTSAFATGNGAPVVRHADCPHCSLPFHYAIVQSTDPGPPQESWHNPVRQAPIRFLAAG